MTIPNPQDIRYGSQVRKELMSNPTTFGSDNGVTNIQPSVSLDQRHQVRFAGPGGAFARYLMNPNNARQANTWNEQFAQSVPGAQFNAEKTRQAQLRADSNAGVVG